MSATEVVYLYSAGQRRHVADPDGRQEMSGRYREPYCENVRYATDEQMVAELRRWNPTEDVDRAINRKRALPLCKRCARKAGHEVAAKPTPAEGAAAVEAMVSEVEHTGEPYVIHRDGAPVAVVVWIGHWEELNAALTEARS